MTNERVDWRKPSRGMWAYGSTNVIDFRDYLLAVDEIERLKALNASQAQALHDRCIEWGREVQRLLRREQQAREILEPMHDCDQTIRDWLSAPSVETSPQTRTEATRAAGGAECLMPKQLDKLIHYAEDGEEDDYPFEVTGEDRKLVLKALRAYRPQAPIAKITVRESGAGHYAPDDLSVTLYSPGLPLGEHEVYCEPYRAAVEPSASHEEGVFCAFCGRQYATGHAPGCKLYMPALSREGSHSP